MYLLYLDESGNENDPSDRHFVLGGMAVFERQVFFLSNAVDEIQTRHFPGFPPIESHASPIRSGRGFWHGVESDKRQDILNHLGRVLRTSDFPGVVLFAAVIEKSSLIWGEKAVEYATEEICSRFDIFLKRRFNDANDNQRGLLIFAEGRFHRRAKTWVQGFRELGTRWGGLKNFCDIPYFASSKESRLLQLADYVAHAAFLLYERRNADLITNILKRFDQKEGIIHGLVHRRSSSIATCDCPACISWTNPHQIGGWIQP